MLGGVFEDSPWVAGGAWCERPFADTADLHGTMCRIVARANIDSRRSLIRAHPDLAGKAAVAGELTEASAREQAGVGLDRMTQEEFERFHRLNDAYRTRFGFPFIIAVRGHTRDSILTSFEARLGNSSDAEECEALRQIERIAWFRLDDLTTTDLAVEDRSPGDRTTKGRQPQNPDPPRSFA